MALNVLYSALTSGRALPQDNWSKVSWTCPLNERATKIRDVLELGVPVTVVRRYVCCLCHEALNSIWADEILKLDPMNTYSDPAKPILDAVAGDPDAYPPISYRLSDVMPVYNDLVTGLKPLVDADIRSAMYGQDWTAVASSGCLQLLREVSNFV